MFPLIRMRHTLKDFSNLLLVVLCDYVLGEPEYLLLSQPSHVALSSDTVAVDFYLNDSDNVTDQNRTITLLDTCTNYTIATKQLPINQSQGTVGFECFHFKAAGLYQFRMVREDENGSETEQGSCVLNVTWPAFHIDLNRTSEAAGSSLQVAVYTSELLCSLGVNKSVVSLDVKQTNGLYESGRLSTDKDLIKWTSKEMILSRSQWVEMDCSSDSQEAYIMVSLTLLDSNLVISSFGPIDLAQKFGYKLVVTAELTCESSVGVLIVPPPCTYVHGKMAVYKETPRRSGDSITSLAENMVHPGRDRTEFNCTLFDIGRNKYCFEFFVFSSKSHVFPRAKECVMIRRDIETWSLWQSWSPCSVKCGDGTRERHRKCLSSSPAKPGCVGAQREISSCSLVDCSTVMPSSKPSPQPSENQKTGNLVTVTGISLCLAIILATVLISMWRKLCKAQKCSSSVRHNPVPTPSFRKNSDEENICHLYPRESFSDSGGDAVPPDAGEAVGLPLTYKRSLQPAEEQPQGPDAPASDSANAQKIIPPIFSYRLAQQQLKEMKKRGLTEETKVYHVSQNPLTDTAVDTSLVPPVVADNQEEVTTNMFRIKSPFSDQTTLHPKFQVERPDFTLFHPTTALSPSQKLARLTHLNYQDSRGDYQTNHNFRRTASFHENKQAKPFRERSLSTHLPRQLPAYTSRARTLDRSVDQRFRSKARGTDDNKPELSKDTVLTSATLSCCPRHHQTRPAASKPDLIHDRQPAARGDKAEPSRNRRGLSPAYRNSWRKVREPACTSRDHHQRSSRGTLSPTQYRRERCQSFPWDAECAFYDNTSFGLTEAEQRMIDLPGYFGSNEEDETSTLSAEKLVI
ncbi:thrombospondin type-1 domain-containing protein 1 [Rhinatrema bivittatum]|uniref:thrombospondin type-1 domain-containing protein 1 n=1 Tax=Rhinatrema bivittatum TaxID=194408 RepID=UPI001129E0DF|nr:thrombospondin type-1 domain-containing protein 1 [Rhinatrema bivittatum]